LSGKRFAVSPNRIGGYIDIPEIKTSPRVKFAAIRQLIREEIVEVYIHKNGALAFSLMPEYMDRDFVHIVQLAIDALKLEDYGA